MSAEPTGQKTKQTAVHAKAKYTGMFQTENHMEKKLAEFRSAS